MLLAVTEQQLEYANWAIVGVGIAMGLAWIVLWLRWRGDPLRAAPQRPSHLRPDCIPACMLAYLLAAAIAQTAIEKFLKPGQPAEVGQLLDRVVVPVIGGLLGAVACVWYGSRGFEGGVRGYGLRLRGAGAEALAGVVGFFVAMAVCAGLLLLCERLIEWARPGWRLPKHPALEALYVSGMPRWTRVCAIVGPIAVSPVAEEFFFRGVVQSFLRQYMPGRWRSILIVAAVFGGAHYTQPQVVLPLAALGVILGYLYERRGSLVAPIVLHVLFNLHTILWQLLLSAGRPA